MAKKYYIAANALGQRFTRSTEGRTYTHMVMLVYNTAQQRREMEQGSRDNYRRNESFHRAYADGTSAFIKPPMYLTNPDEFFESMTDESRAIALKEHNERAAESIAHAKSVLAAEEEGRVAADLAAFDHSIANNRLTNADRSEFYAEAGWCGRLELAHKLVSKHIGRKDIADALILEAIEVTGQEFRKSK